MRLELDRQLDARGGRGAGRGRRARRSRELQLAVGDFARHAAMVDRMAAAVQAAAGGAHARGGRGDRGVPRHGCARGTSSCSAPARTTIADGPGRCRPCRFSPARGSASCATTARRASPSRRRVNELPEFLRERLVGDGDLLVIGKTNRRSRVHRRARMDDVSVRVLRPDGTIAGLLRVIGLFTSLVYLEQASRTPLLRRKLQAIIEAEGLIEGSHDYKATVAAFESFPRDELFQAPVEALRAEIVAAARAEEAQRVTLTVRRDAASRNITVMVADAGRPHVDRAAHPPAGAARRSATTPSRSEYHLALVEGAAAQLFFLLHVPGRGRARGAARTSSSRRSPGSRAPGTTASSTSSSRATATPRAGGSRRSTAARLPEYYKTATLARARARRHRAARARGRRRGVRRRHPERAAGAHAGRRAAAHAGHGRDARRQDPAGRAPARARGARPDGHGGGADAPRRRRRRRLPARFRRARRRRAARLRARRRAARQRPSPRSGAGASSRTRSTRSSMRAGPARRRRRDPARLPPLPPHRCADIHRRVPERRAVRPPADGARCSSSSSARASASAGDERARGRVARAAGRAARGASAASTRTASCAASRRSSTPRCARTPRSARDYLSFKLRSADVPQMPAPAPLFEIFVYHPLVEGIHLRGGHVARGGIRWSDRREDYRSEVLGPDEGPDGQERRHRARSARRAASSCARRRPIATRCATRCGCATRR